MSTWLGIDTSTDVCAGLAVDGVVVASRLLADRRAHAEQLMPMIVSMLADQGVSLGDVDGIAVGVGPGPFTGLRVGVATAFGIASATGAAVRGVCSLDVVAAQWARAGAPEEFVAVSDARRREVYWARYAAAGSRLAGPFVTAPSEVPALPSCGPGALLLTSEPSDPGVDQDASGPAGVAAPASLDAGVLALVGPALPDAGLTPLYLRRPDAEVSTSRKSTLLQPRLTLGRRG